MVNKTSDDNGSHFRISLKQLAKSTNQVVGSLSGLILKLPDNEMMLIPGYTEKEPTPGIPLEIWTENYVSGDNQGERFEIAKSDSTTVWVKLINNSPVFNQPSVIRIEKESDIEQGKINLVEIEKVFTDADKNDMKIIEIETSDKLKDILEFDKKTNELKFHQAYLIWMNCQQDCIKSSSG